MTQTHSTGVGYLLLLFGFTGAHRFYFGKQLTGLLWLCTGGLFGIGWIIDIFLVPSMDREAERRYAAGDKDYTVAWVLQTFLGPLGIHRFYLGKWATGLLWLVSGGLFGLGWAYDFLTLNEQIDAANRR